MLFNPLNKYLGGDTRTSSVKKNILGSILIKGISILISLLLVPMTLGFVDAEMYGIWLTMSSIMMWLNFFDVGFTHGLKNKLAEAIAHRDWHRGKSLVSTTYVIMALIFIPLVIVICLLIPFVNWPAFLNVDSKYNDDIIKALYVIAICFGFQMISNVLVAIVSAFQKVAFANSFNVIGNCLTIVVIFFLTKFCESSLMLLALAVSLSPIVVLFIASLILFNGRLRSVAPEISSFDKNSVNSLFNLGFKFFLIQIQFVVLYQTTNLLISHLSSPLQVTEYNIAYKYLGIGMMLYTIILQPLWPAFTDAFAKKDYKWMNNIYNKMIKVFLLCALVLCVMILLSSFFYKLWIGSKVEISFYMTLLVGIYMIVHQWDQLQVQLINGIGFVKLQVYVTSIGLFLHIPLSFFFGHYMGGIGVVLSMIIINIIYASFFTIQIRKILSKKEKGIWAK